MGELAEFRNQLAGTFGFNDLISQGDNDATIKKLLRIMVPTVEMRDFQRRYKFDSNNINLTVGQRISQTLWTVPQREHWRPAALFMKHSDTVVHDFITFHTVDPGSALQFQSSRTRVDANTGKLIFGTDQDGTMSGGVNTFWMAKVPITLSPTDSFGFFDDDTVAAAGALFEWTFVYELVPAPATKLVQGVKGAVTVV